MDLKFKDYGNRYDLYAFDFSVGCYSFFLISDIQDNKRRR